MQSIQANVLSSDVHSQLQFCVAMKRLSAWVQRGYVMPHCGESRSLPEWCCLTQPTESSKNANESHNSQQNIHRNKSKKNRLEEKRKNQHYVS